MKSIDNMQYHPVSEKVVEVLIKKTQSKNPLFFRVLIGYYFCKIASMMRCDIVTHDRGKIPINMYAINLASSGQGKGHSTNIIEEQIIDKFRNDFTDATFPVISVESLEKLALKRSTIKNNNESDEQVRVEKEFNSLGNLAFSFDSGTTAAVKQMRHKLLMAKAGSMNMEIDEIGSNLLGNIEVLTTFLELFDVGKIKAKLTKNTAENIRTEEIEGRTPTNLMLFGTPAKLLNGGKVEEEFITMLDTGYARRCLFGYTKADKKTFELTPKEIYDMLTDKSSSTFLQQLSIDLGKLADLSFFGIDLIISEKVSILLIEYKMQCEKIADNLPSHQEILKAETAHRYFKALKLAGAYAFIDQNYQVTEDNLYAAIKLVEASGESFKALLNRERNYVKLAKYIASVDREVTHVDILEDLPFYKGTETQKRDLLTMAIAYGYKNNIVIKKIFNDGIEFLKGESLNETDLDKITLSYGSRLAEDYKNVTVPFNKLHQLTQLDNRHWVGHHLLDGYRKEENCIQGFNLIIIDIDKDVSVETAKLLMQKYTYLIYTTKRHTEKANRFRMIFPMSHELKMDSEEYKEFMVNVYEWLPFPSDEQTNQRSRKWETFNGDHWYNSGELLNDLMFIPKTTKNEERKKIVLDQKGLTNLERWFIGATGIGNRSNQLIKYAYMLVDSGFTLEQVKSGVLNLNSKLQDKMDETEILSTIIVSASKAIYKRDL